MLFCFIAGSLVTLSSGMNAFRAHQQGKETQTTIFLGGLMFGLALLVVPMLGSSKQVTPAEAAVPTSAASARVFSGKINIPEARYDGNGRMLLQSATTDIDYDLCLQAITMIASNLGVAPTNILETSIARIVRFPSNDGSVMMSCSRPDQKLVVTLSPNRG